jgi:hypothetical protein
MFTENQFVPTQWNTAKDKADFCNRFVKFVQSGCDRKLFTNKFYKDLSMMFGHIANYNEDGFYSTFFITPRGRVDFASHTETCHCYGDPTFTWSDAEKLLKAWAIENKMLSNEIRNLNEAVEKKEREELARLKLKYEGG